MRFGPGIAVLALLLSSCSSSENVNAAKEATENFHRLMDAGDFTAIYKGSSTVAMKHALTLEQWNAFLARVNHKMGKCGDPKTTLGRYFVSTNGTTVTIISKRQCASGELQEVFVWLMISKQPLLFGYQANNPLLLSD